jgi:hypothetical protein
MKGTLASIFFSALLITACGQSAPDPFSLLSESSLYRVSPFWAEHAADCSTENVSRQGFLQLTESEFIFGQRHEALYRFEWAGLQGTAITRPHHDVTNKALESTYALTLSEDSTTLTLVNQKTGARVDYQNCQILTTKP